MQDRVKSRYIICIIQIYNTIGITSCMRKSSSTTQCFLSTKQTCTHYTVKIFNSKCLHMFSSHNFGQLLSTYCGGWPNQRTCAHAWHLNRALFEIYHKFKGVACTWADKYKSIYGRLVWTNLFFLRLSGQKKKNCWE